MGRRKYGHTSGLSPEQQERLIWLRQYTAQRKEAKGQTGTVYDDELAKLEALEGELPDMPSLPEPAEPDKESD